MTTTRQRAAQAAAVSRALRRGGLNPLGSGSSRMRQGIRVSKGWSAVRVGFDCDSDHVAERLRQDAAEILTAAGYAVEVTETGALLATREAS